jgi:hypothetical protein
LREAGELESREALGIHPEAQGLAARRLARSGRSDVDDTIQAGDLPKSFEDEVGRLLADYTVAFMRVEPGGGDPDLLGTGVLVQIEDTRAILTAHHVVQRLARTGRLAVFLGPTNETHTVDTGGLRFLEIARGRVDADGPDLGAVVLAPTIGGAIGAKKIFYNMAIRREQALYKPPSLDDGVWVANGFLAERTMAIQEPDGRRVKGFYNFSAFGGPEVSPKIGESDYFEYPVTLESREGAPQSWGGMSGSGLWQVPLKREHGSVVAACVPLLSGILFYQHPTTATTCGVRAHGRESIYRVAYDKIRGL